MTHLLNPTIRLLESDPDVKSYIYQQLNDLESFVTEDTVMTVLARDPRKLSLQLETDGKAIPPEKLRKMHRVAIILQEGDTQLQEEGLHEDVFEAIRAAKDAMLQRLLAIQDQVITNQDRMAQINGALQNNQLH